MSTGQAGDGREAALLAHVKSTATPNDPQSVLDAIDHFAWSNTWLMNVGDVKGKHLDEELAKNQPKNALEVGCYIGYSAVRIASQLPPGGKLYSVDFSPENVKIAKEVVELAGLNGRVEFLVGVLSNVTKDLKARANAFDLVFLDHEKSFYLSDLKLLISEAFLKRGSVVIADNVLIPGAPEYLAFMEESKDFVTEKHQTEVEYMKHLKDMVTVSVYRGAT